MTTQMKFETAKISVFRLPRDNPQEFHALATKKLAALAKFDEFLRLAQNEPFCFDDEFRGMAPQGIWQALLNRGEVIVGFDSQGLPGSLHILSDIRENRHAMWHTVTRPDLRRTGATHEWTRQVFEYAFSPWGPSGLGLMKLKATVSVQNSAALRAAQKAGGVAVGRLVNEALFLGQPSDMMLLEFYSNMMSNGNDEAFEDEPNELEPLQRTTQPMGALSVQQQPVQRPVVAQAVRRNGPGVVRQVVDPNAQYMSRKSDQYQGIFERNYNGIDLVQGGQGLTQEQVFESSPRGSAGNTSSDYGASVNDMLSPRYWQQKGYDVEVT